MNVDTFKSIINKRGGLAPSNRYAVYIPLPLISFDPQEFVAGLFDQGNSGKNNLFQDPRDISILCDSATMPGRQIATNELQNNMLGIKMPYGYINDDVTMSFHVTNDHYAKKIFENWVNKMFDRRRMIMKYRSSYTSDIIIQQLDQRDVPVYTCTLRNAYPVTISSYEVSNSAESTTQKLSITFAYEDWNEEGFVESVLSKGKLLLGSVGKTLGF